MAPALSCSHCAAPLPPEVVAAESAHCPGCRRWLKVVAFPALVAEAKQGAFGDRVLVEGESTCFYHAEKKASVVCAGCGRFLCSLCDIEMKGEHLCAGCLESGRGTAAQKLDSERFLYEDIALLLAIAGIFIGPFGIITALAAIFTAIRHWRKPEKVGGLGKTKKIVAILLALVVAVFWGVLLLMMAGEIIG